MIITIRERSWKKAGHGLEHALVLKRASGRPFKKKLLIEVLSVIWKVAQILTFSRVDKVLDGGPWC